MAVLRQFGIAQRQFLTEQITFEISGVTTPLGTIKKSFNDPLFSRCHLTIPAFGVSNLMVAILPFVCWFLIAISLPYFFNVQEACLFEFL